MKKKFNEVFRPVIDSQETITIGHLEINEEPIVEAYVDPKYKTINYSENEFKKWEADVKKFDGYVEIDHHGGMGGVKTHIARMKGDDESHFGAFTIGSSRQKGGALTIDSNKHLVKEVEELDETPEYTQPVIDMSAPINALIEEINHLKKSIIAQGVLIKELQERPVVESVEIDNTLIESLEKRIKKLETKKIAEAKPKGWVIERDEDGNLTKFVPEE